MAYFEEVFKEIARDPHGEPLRPGLFIRLKDGPDGSPGTLVTVLDTQEITKISEIRRQREVEFGVVKGQVWQILVTNNDLGMLNYELKDCWVCISGSFPGAGLEKVFGQGKIKKKTTSTDGVVALEVHDMVMGLLGAELRRDIFFQDTAWVGELGSSVLSASSTRYDNDATGAGVEFWGDPAGLVQDETFIVEFTAATDFKIILEDGDESQIGHVWTNTLIYGTAASGLLNRFLIINFEGWDQDAGAYAAGDQFVFYTARPRTSDELTPIYMVMNLIKDFAGITAYDVKAGAEYSSPLYDEADWLALASSLSTRAISGFWAKGTAIIKPIQDALKLSHGSIFPTPTGQIGLWVLRPSTDISVRLNGVIGVGAVDIKSAERSEDITVAANEVTMEYLTATGDQASVTSENAPDQAQYGIRPKTIVVDWRCAGSAAKDVCDKYLNRFLGGLDGYVMRTTLAGAVAEIGSGAVMTDDAIGLVQKRSDVTSVSVGLEKNTATVEAYHDPVVTANYFILGESLLGGPEVLW